jgi:dihydrofolate synthase/folylpolyglutamate synthase
MVPDLDRITLLLELLGQPQRSYPTIHVTGTNGKGSVVRMATMLLGAAGLSAGAYTSPHLQTIRERLQVAGRRIGEQAFAELYADVAPLAGLVDERSADAVTYFELLTAMASWWFAEVPVDVGVFEVGMGGTWDATNLVRGDVAVLQPIDVDHSELGDEPVAVAKEKAGIIKHGSHVVLGPQRDDVLAVIRARAEDVGAELRLFGTDHELLRRQVTTGGQTIDVRIGERVLRDLYVPLHGVHQADNAVVALAAVAGLLGDTFDDLAEDALRQGLLSTTVPGRLEVVHREPTVVVDGAHNPHGARAAAAAFEEAFTAEGITLVVGVLGDKDVRGILAPWKELASHVVVCRPPSPRALPVDRLAAVAEELWSGTGVVVEQADDVVTALGMAHSVTGPRDAVLVCGSLFTVGAARDHYLPVLDDDDEVVLEPEDVDDDEHEEAFGAALEAMIERLDAERGSVDPDDLGL